jgi:hypothetical protein
MESAVQLSLLQAAAAAIIPAMVMALVMETVQGMVMVPEMVTVPGTEMVRATAMVQETVTALVMVMVLATETAPVTETETVLAMAMEIRQRQNSVATLVLPVRMGLSASVPTFLASLSIPASFQLRAHLTRPTAAMTARSVSQICSALAMHASTAQAMALIIAVTLANAAMVSFA